MMRFINLCPSSSNSAMAQLPGRLMEQSSEQSSSVLLLEAEVVDK